MNALLLVLALTTSTLVLQSGDRIVVDGPLTEAGGVYMFRSGGALYSIATEEVVRIDTATPVEEEKPKKMLRLSTEERKRLIEDLEQNHEGTPPAPQRLIDDPPPPDEPDPDEDMWRSRAKAHEEDLRRAKENLLLIETRIEELRNQIFNFVSLGFRPGQFSHQTTLLAWNENQLPYARLEVTRAERQWQHFKEDARRAGVLPGWLRNH